MSSRKSVILSVSTLVALGASVLVVQPESVFAQAQQPPASTPAPAPAPAEKSTITPPAQTPPAPARRRTKVSRKPLIDLQAEAKDRRPGQVMPGDPAESVDLPLTPLPGEEELPLADQKPAPLTLADTAPIPATPKPASPSPASAPTPTQPSASPQPAASAAAPSSPVVRVLPAATDDTVAADPQPELKRVEPVLEPVAPSTPPPAPIPVAEPVSLSGASVEVVAVQGEADAAQWRALGTDPNAARWIALSPGQHAQARVEVRVGLSGSVTLNVDSGVEMRLDRLARAVIERGKASESSTGVLITLQRGAANIRPITTNAGGGQSVWIKTPDRVMLITTPSRIEYDAFTGTRILPVSE